MKRYSVTEEIVMNPALEEKLKILKPYYIHIRCGRIEKWTQGPYHDEVGYIRVPKEMFDTIRDIIDDWED